MPYSPLPRFPTGERTSRGPERARPACRGGPADSGSTASPTRGPPTPAAPAGDARCRAETRPRRPQWRGSFSRRAERAAGAWQAPHGFL